MDGMKAESILEASDPLLTILVVTFHQVLPPVVLACWCVGGMHPVSKAGNRNDPGSYRSITAVVILAKLYAMGLNARATAWAEDTRCRAQIYEALIDEFAGPSSWRYWLGDGLEAGQQKVMLLLHGKHQSKSGSQRC